MMWKVAVIVAVALFSGLCLAQTVPVKHNVRVTWDANTTPNVTYRVQRSETTGTGYVQVASGLTSALWLDTSVTNGKTYYYRVVAELDGLQSDPSVEVSAVIPDKKRPIVPLNPKAEVIVAQ